MTATASALTRAFHCLAMAEDGARSGQRELALRLYGQAIDDLLDERLYAMAAAACSRLIQSFPDVTRARATLSVLSLAECLEARSPALLRAVRRELEVYLAACRERHQHEMAVRFLRRLVEVTEAPDLREWLSDVLSDMGDRDAAEQALVAACEERQGIRPPRRLPGDQRARWATVLRTPLHHAA